MEDTAATRPTCAPSTRCRASRIPLRSSAPCCRCNCFATSRTTVPTWSRAPDRGGHRRRAGGGTGCRAVKSTRSAALVLAAAALMFSAMALFAKEASLRLPGPQVAFVRFLFGIATCAAVSLRVPLRANNKIGLLMRGAFGGAAALCFFLAIEHLPVGLATLLNYTAPLFAALLAALFLDEPLEPATILALALATLGVALVATGGGGRIGGAPYLRWVLVGALSAGLFR